jgi:concanavalin A-like lectin/glucanase superfamily protein
MRKIYFPKIDKITDDIDGQNHSINELGYMNIHATEDYKIAPGILGKEWREDELPNEDGWLFSHTMTVDPKDAKIKVVSNFPEESSTNSEHFKPVKLTQATVTDFKTAQGVIGGKWDLISRQWVAGSSPVGDVSSNGATVISTFGEHELVCELTSGESIEMYSPIELKWGYCDFWLHAPQTTGESIIDFINTVNSTDPLIQIGLSGGKIYYYSTIGGSKVELGSYSEGKFSHVRVFFNATENSTQLGCYIFLNQLYIGFAPIISTGEESFNKIRIKSIGGTSYVDAIGCSWLNDYQSWTNFLNSTWISKAYNFEYQSEGFMSFWITNTSVNPTSKAIVELFYIDKDPEKLQTKPMLRHSYLELFQGDINVQDGDTMKVLGLYYPNEFVHIMIKWDFQYHTYYINGQAVHTVEHENINSGAIDGINKFLFRTDYIGGNTIYVDAILTSLEGESFEERFDNIEAGVLNTKGLTSNYGLFKNIQADFAIIDNEGNYKNAEGILGKQWIIGDQPNDLELINYGNDLPFSQRIHDDYCVIHVQFDDLSCNPWESFNDVHEVRTGTTSPNPNETGVDPAYGIWQFDNEDPLVGIKSLYLDPNNELTGDRPANYPIAYKKWEHNGWLKYGSVECFFEPSELTPGLIMSGSGDETGSDIYLQIGIKVDTEQTGDVKIIYATHQHGAGTYQDLESNLPLYVGQKYHIAYTWGPAGRFLYVDGVKVDSATETGDGEEIVSTCKYFGIGSATDLISLENRAAIGKWDEFRFSDIQRSTFWLGAIYSDATIIPRFAEHVNVCRIQPKAEFSESPFEYDPLVFPYDYIPESIVQFRTNTYRTEGMFDFFFTYSWEDSIRYTEKIGENLITKFDDYAALIQLRNAEQQLTAVELKLSEGMISYRKTYDHKLATGIVQWEAQTNYSEPWGGNGTVSVSDNVYIDPLFKGHKDVLKLADSEQLPTGQETQSAEISFSNQMGQSMEFWIAVGGVPENNTGSGSGYEDLVINVDNGIGDGIKIIFENGNIYYYTGEYYAKTDSHMKYQENQWMHLKFDFYYDNEETEYVWDFIINNILVNEKNLFPSGITFLNKFSLKTGINETNYDIFLDAIGFSWNNYISGSNNDIFKPIGAYSPEQLSHFHLEYNGQKISESSKSGCQIYLDGEKVGTAPLLEEFLDINSIRFHINKNAAYLDALGTSWKNFTSFANVSDGTLLTKGILATNIISDIVKAPKILVDSHGDFKVGNGILGKEWNVGSILNEDPSDPINKYGWNEIDTRPPVKAEIIDYLDGHSLVLRIEREMEDTGGNIEGTLHHLVGIDNREVDYELWVYPTNNIQSTGTTQRVAFGLVENQSEGDPGVAKIILASEDNMILIENQSDGSSDPTYISTGFSYFVNQWQHFRVEWKKLEYLRIFLNSRKIYDGPDPSEDVGFLLPDNFELSVTESTAYFDAIGLSNHGYNPYTNLSDGLISTSGINAEVVKVGSLISDHHIDLTSRRIACSGYAQPDWNLYHHKSNLITDALEHTWLIPLAVPAGAKILKIFCQLKGSFTDGTGNFREMRLMAANFNGDPEEELESILETSTTTDPNFSQDLAVFIQNDRAYFLEISILESTANTAASYHIVIPYVDVENF